MEHHYFREYLRTHQFMIKQRCLVAIGSRSNFSSQSLSVEQIIDVVSSAACDQMKEGEIVPIFLELGVRLAREGWPIRLALEVVHAYPAAVWNEFGSSSESANGVQVRQVRIEEKNQLIHRNFEAEDFQQLSQVVNSWVEWLVDAYVAQKEGFITDLYQQLAETNFSQNAQLEAAQATAATVCHRLSQPLTVLNFLSDMSSYDNLHPDEVQWLRDAVQEARHVVQKLQNLKRYETMLLYPDGQQILDLDASSMPDLQQIPGYNNHFRSEFE